MRGKKDTSTLLMLCGLLVAAAPIGVVLTGDLVAREAQQIQLEAWQGAALGSRTASPAFPFLVEIPAIRLRWLIYQGADVSTLRRHGAGFIVGTASPGQPGVAGIAGHRTTYGAPFWNLGRLEPGDVVLITTGRAHLTYRVLWKTQVAPTAVEILRTHAPGSFLVLITCSPRFSAAYRLAVFAALSGTRDMGAVSRQEVP